MEAAPKSRAPRNRTLTLTGDELSRYAAKLLQPPLPARQAQWVNRILCAEMSAVCPLLAPASVDLLILDPPYNLDKSFADEKFRELSTAEYERHFEAWLTPLLPCLKPTASLYVCGDWKSSTALQRVLERHARVRNRITWEREKGRGARANWKNSSEDIWFCTMSNDYYFNVEAVKLKRRVIAPYKVDGQPKDWARTDAGDFRLTHPSNLWTDLTIPFWSMPENTEHPTQKPEKLIAKLILASSREGDLILDPFLGSGTTAAVARKLGRNVIGIEQNKRYACLAAKRFELAAGNASIQGYADGVFWERNTLAAQPRDDRRRRGQTTFEQEPLQLIG